MAWYSDDALVSQLPPMYRALARYNRMFVNQGSGLVRGGSFLQRVVSQSTRLLGLRQTQRVALGDVSVHLDLVDPRVWWVLDEVRGGAPEHRVFDTYLSSGDTFVDVGANHGGFSIYCARLVGGSGFVAAVEPQPRLADLVRRSLGHNEAAQFQVLQMACGEKNGEALLHVPHLGSGSASLFANYAPGKKRRFRVAVRPFDEAVDWESFPGRVVVKIDVEGSELAFLRGARSMIAKRRPVVLVEMNPDSALAAGGSSHELLELLSGLGYDRGCSVENFPNWQALSELDHSRQHNVVILPSGV